MESHINLKGADFIGMIEEALEKQLEGLYRFCSSPSEINWKARRKIDCAVVRDAILPAMLRFVEESVRKATYQTGRSQEMRAVVGLSGGIDSTVLSYVIAKSMQESVRFGRSEEAYLALVNFDGLESSPTREIVENMALQFDNVRLDYLVGDVVPSRSAMHTSLKELVRKSKYFERSNLLDVSGELTTRAICSILNEFGYRMNLATVDTTNGTEWVLGEFSVGLGYDVVLLTDIYKSGVYALGDAVRTPEELLVQDPRNSAFSHATKAELYFGELPEGVTSRQAFEVLDPVLFWLYEEGKRPEELSERLGHSVEFVQRVKTRIKNQKPRQKPPVFCLETQGRRYHRGTSLNSQKMHEITRREMLGHLFE